MEMNNCDKETAILLDAMLKLNSMAQWKLMYDTGLWKVKPDYAFAMLERYGQLFYGSEEDITEESGDHASISPPPQKRMRESLIIKQKQRACQCKDTVIP